MSYSAGGDGRTGGPPASSRGGYALLPGSNAGNSDASPSGQNTCRTAQQLQHEGSGMEMTGNVNNNNTNNGKNSGGSALPPLSLPASTAGGMRSDDLLLIPPYHHPHPPPTQGVYRPYVNNNNNNELLTQQQPLTPPIELCDAGNSALHGRTPTGGGDAAATTTRGSAGEVDNQTPIRHPPVSSVGSSPSSHSTNGNNNNNNNLNGLRWWRSTSTSRVSPVMGPAAPSTTTPHLHIGVVDGAGDASKNATMFPNHHQHAQTAQLRELSPRTRRWMTSATPTATHNSAPPQSRSLRRVQSSGGVAEALSSLAASKHRLQQRLSSHSARDAPPPPQLPREEQRATPLSHPQQQHVTDKTAETQASQQEDHKNDMTNNGSTDPHPHRQKPVSVGEIMKAVARPRTGHRQQDDDGDDDDYEPNSYTPVHHRYDTDASAPHDYLQLQPLASQYASNATVSSSSSTASASARGRLNTLGATQQRIGGGHPPVFAHSTTTTTGYARPGTSSSKKGGDMYALLAHGGGTVTNSHHHTTTTTINNNNKNNNNNSSSAPSFTPDTSDRQHTTSSTATAADNPLPSLFTSPNTFCSPSPIAATAAASPTSPLKAAPTTMESPSLPTPITVLPVDPVTYATATRRRSLSEAENTAAAEKAHYTDRGGLLRGTPSDEGLHVDADDSDIDAHRVMTTTKQLKRHAEGVEEEKGSRSSSRRSSLRRGSMSQKDALMAAIAAAEAVAQSTPNAMSALPPPPMAFSHPKSALDALPPVTSGVAISRGGGGGGEALSMPHASSEKESSSAAPIVLPSLLVHPGDGTSHADTTTVSSTGSAYSPHFTATTSIGAAGEAGAPQSPHLVPSFETRGDVDTSTGETDNKTPIGTSDGGLSADPRRLPHALPPSSVAPPSTAESHTLEPPFHAPNNKNNTTLAFNPSASSTLNIFALMSELEQRRQKLRQRLAEVARNLADHSIFAIVRSASTTQLHQLLQAGVCDVNEQDHNGCTPLHIAASEGNQAIVRLLLSYGADILKKDLFGRTPLDCAAANRQSVGRYLLTVLRERRAAAAAERAAAAQPNRYPDTSPASTTQHTNNAMVTKALDPTTAFSAAEGGAHTASACNGDYDDDEDGYHDTNSDDNINGEEGGACIGSPQLPPTQNFHSALLSVMNNDDGTSGVFSPPIATAAPPATSLPFSHTNRVPAPSGADGLIPYEASPVCRLPPAGFPRANTGEVDASACASLPVPAPPHLAMNLVHSVVDVRDANFLISTPQMAPIASPSQWMTNPNANAAAGGSAMYPQSPGSYRRSILPGAVEERYRAAAAAAAATAAAHRQPAVTSGTPSALEDEGLLPKKEDGGEEAAGVVPHVVTESSPLLLAHPSEGNRLFTEESSNSFSHLGVRNHSFIDDASIRTLMEHAAAQEQHRRHASKHQKKEFSSFITVNDHVPLIVCMSGLPGRGKSFISKRLVRYLNWKGVPCAVFNAGNYRRQLLGVEGTADAAFFDPSNPVGKQLRERMAELACEDLVKFIAEHPLSVGILDATNTTRSRRKWLEGFFAQSAKNHAQPDGTPLIYRLLFIESVCTDESIITENILRSKCDNDDFKGTADTNAVISEFRERIHQYEKVYEPLHAEENFSFIKIINVKHHVVLHHVVGGLGSRIAFFLMNLHPVAYPVYLALPGETVGESHHVFGGDQKLTEQGRQYALALREFMEERFVPNMLVIHATSKAVVNTLLPIATSPTNNPAIGTTTSAAVPELPGFDEFASPTAGGGGPTGGTTTSVASYNSFRRVPRNPSGEDITTQLPPPPTHHHSHHHHHHHSGHHHASLKGGHGLFHSSMTSSPVNLGPSGGAIATTTASPTGASVASPTTGNAGTMGAGGGGGRGMPRVVSADRLLLERQLTGGKAAVPVVVHRHLYNSANPSHHHGMLSSSMTSGPVPSTLNNTNTTTTAVAFDDQILGGVGIATPLGANEGHHPSQSAGGGGGGGEDTGDHQQQHPLTASVLPPLLINNNNSNANTLLVSAAHAASEAHPMSANSAAATTGSAMVVDSSSSSSAPHHVQLFSPNHYPGEDLNYGDHKGNQSEFASNNKNREGNVDDEAAASASSVSSASSSSSTTCLELVEVVQGPHESSSTSSIAPEEGNEDTTRNPTPRHEGGEESTTSQPVQPIHPPTSSLLARHHQRHLLQSQNTSQQALPSATSSTATEGGGVAPPPHHHHHPQHHRSQRASRRSSTHSHTFSHSTTSFMTAASTAQAEERLTMEKIRMVAHSGLGGIGAGGLGAAGAQGSISSARSAGNTNQNNNNEKLEEESTQRPVNDGNPAWFPGSPVHGAPGAGSSGGRHGDEEGDDHPQPHHSGGTANVGGGAVKGVVASGGGARYEGKEEDMEEGEALDEVLCPVPGLDDINYGRLNGRQPQWLQQQNPRVAHILFSKLRKTNSAASLMLNGTASELDECDNDDEDDSDDEELAKELAAAEKVESGDEDQHVRSGDGQLLRTKPPLLPEVIRGDNSRRLMAALHRCWARFDKYFDDSVHSSSTAPTFYPTLNYAAIFPNGESFRQVVSRLEPALMAVMRAQKPVFVIAPVIPTQGLLAFFLDIMPEKSPLLKLPKNGVLEITVKGDVVVHPLLPPPPPPIMSSLPPSPIPGTAAAWPSTPAVVGGSQSRTSNNNSPA